MDRIEPFHHLRMDYKLKLDFK